MAALLKLDVTYAARRPWVPRRAQFVHWAGMALNCDSAATDGGDMATKKTFAGRKPAAVKVRETSAHGRGPQARGDRDAGGSSRATLLSVHVVGMARSRSLNARYRSKDKPTNVLSFHGIGTAPDGSNHLGELVICAPLVAQEAASQGKSAQAHWAHLTVHGVLHLLGFDHERNADARKMAVREVQILDRLGFSNPYP